jgi:hypothetical protein
MISIHGRRAEKMRAALPPGIDAVVFDESGVLDAAREGAERRRRGERYAVMAVIDDSRVRLNSSAAVEISRATNDLEYRYYSCLQLARGQTLVGNEPIRAAWEREALALRAAVLSVISEADEVLVRSNAEIAAFYQWSAACRGRVFRRVLLADSVPAFERRLPDRPSVVVWTGLRDTVDATLALIGLEEFRGDVTYVGDAPLPRVAGRFIARTDPALSEVLAVAGCIVCIDPADPTDAAAFARRGVPVVATTTSAAYEFVDGVISWDAGDSSRLSFAVAYALGCGATGTAPDTVTPQPLAPALPVDQDRLPLVTVLTATYNRRAHLAQMLTCLAAQTYPNLEAIIINDAGEPVDDIVAGFPFARLVNAETNCGTFFSASRLGFAVARGEYIAMLPDDDWFYPDHIERLMGAILRSGAAVAHSFGLLRFLRRHADGTEYTYGVNPLPYSATTSPTPALLGTPIAMHQCLLRRDTFAPGDVGWPLLEAAGGDQEYHMRLLERHALAAVDRFTCEFRDHPGNSGKGYDWADAMTEVYETFQPATGRSHTQALRRDAIAQIRAVPFGTNVNEPAIVFFKEP